jgi:hypothetical protein
MILNINRNTNFNKFNIYGVYLLTCRDCNRYHIGQTGSFFLYDYKNIYRISNMQMENQISHKNLYNKQSNWYIEGIMEVLHIARKGSMMNTWEKFHIHMQCLSECGWTSTKFQSWQELRVTVRTVSVGSFTLLTINKKDWKIR